MGRFVILSGPSCVGKGPLYTALKLFFPEYAKTMNKLVLYNSRAARPGEIDGLDYHFRPREEIENLRNKQNFIVMNVRSDVQAIHLDALEKILKTGNAFFEGNPFVGKELLGIARSKKIPCTNAFLSPLSKDEILYLKQVEPKVNLPDFITDVMRRKLLRRTRKQKTLLSLKDLENIETRASSAYKEMKEAFRFDCVIPNHDGEDSENWSAFYYPVGDARLVLLSFVELLKVNQPKRAEQWEEHLLP